LKKNRLKNIKELKAIAEALKVGEKCGLTSEILWSFFHYFLDSKINKSNKDIQDAIAYGINEWIK
jgi:hypothetical protein